MHESYIVLKVLIEAPPWCNRTYLHQTPSANGIDRVCQKAGSPALLMTSCGSVITLRRHEHLNPVSRSSPGAPRRHEHYRADYHLDRDHDSAPSELSGFCQKLPQLVFERESI